MIAMLKKLFTFRKNTDLSEYSGFSDFFLRASEDTKKKVITEAARKANEDQLKVFKDAQLKQVS